MFRVSVVLAMSIAGGVQLDAAHAATPVPSPVIPSPGGQVQSTLPTAPPLPQPKTAPSVTPPTQAPALIPPGGPTVTVQRFDISGNTVYGDAVLQPVVARFLNQPLTLAELYKAADAITDYYQSHGYSIARATLPEQKLDEGVLKIQVVEGRVGQVSFEGNSRTRTPVLQHEAAALKPGDVYTDAAMDRAVLLVNDLPGVSAQAVLQPGSAFGTADVIYKADETRYSGQISADDYGRQSTGRMRLNASLTVNSLTGSGDRLDAGLTHAEHNLLNFGSLDYSLPLGPDGGRLTAGYNQSEYHLATFDITDTSKVSTYKLRIGGSNRNANLGWQYPLLRSHDQNLYWGIGLQHEGTTTTSLGKTVASTSLNALQLNFFYNETGQDGSSKTLDGGFTSNGGKNPNGVSTSAEQARVTLDGSLSQPLGGFTFVGRAGGQWSADPLTDIDKYSLGGPDSVRGYESAEARGDSGLFASAEFQHPVPAWPFTAGWFVDAGKVWTESLIELKPLGPVTRLGQTVNEFETVRAGASHATLAASGFELIYTPASRTWEARLQWAFGFGGYKPVESDEGGHIWATLGFNF